MTVNALYLNSKTVIQSRISASIWNMDYNMVYSDSTILGCINVLNHQQLPSVYIWSTHTQNESQDITNICWNFLWTCPVYFTLQIDRSKTGSEKHNLTRVTLSFNYHSATHSVSDHPPRCIKFFFAEAEMSSGTTVSTQPGIDHGVSTQTWESSGGTKLP